MSLQSGGYQYAVQKEDGKKEAPLLGRMREDYKFFGGLSVAYGIIFSFCLYKNLHGITFPVCVAVTIAVSILFLHRINFKLAKRSMPYIIGMVLLGISTAYTSSFFFHFLMRLELSCCFMFL